MFLNLIKSTIKRTGLRPLSSAASVQTTSPSSKTLELPSYRENREIWVENLDSEDEKKLEILELNKDVFGVTPRIDIIQKNIEWQKLYKYVSFAHTKTRAEVRGGGRKPWPQKGLGRARHGSIRSPLWRGGGIVHGPRSPTSHFYMLPFYVRVFGLTSTLSVKLAQDDLHVVKDLEIPTDNSSYIKDLVEKRNWGPSVLFVDDNDLMPENIAIATDEVSYINLMPVYGLNVYSMLKHDTLVLTKSAVENIQEKILFQLHRPDNMQFSKKFRVNQK